MPAAAAVARATADPVALQAAQRRGLLTWWRPDADGARRLVDAWLAVTERISSGDFAEVTSFTNQGALAALNRLAAEGLVRRGDAARGRLAHFVAASH